VPIGEPTYYYTPPIGRAKNRICKTGQHLAANKKNGVVQSGPN